MSVPFISLTEIKTFIGKTGTDDDLLIASIASNASAMAERHTGRVFAVQSNTSYTYSTDNQASITIHDRPVSDATRVVTVGGVAQVENTSYWLLPDRRDPTTSITIQLRYYDYANPEWYKAIPNWWDANLDSPRYLASGAPNDLQITGTVGHPQIPGDVKAGTLELAAYLYWRTKGGASSFAESLAGTDVSLSTLPRAYQEMVEAWKVRTAVMGV